MFKQLLLNILRNLRSGRALVLAIVEVVLLLVHHVGGPEIQLEKVIPFFDKVMQALELFVIPMLATGGAHNAPQPDSALPNKTMGSGLVLIVLVALLVGCGGMSLEKARGPSKLVGTSPELSEHCLRLDTKIRRSNVAIYVGSGLAAAAIPPALTFDDPRNAALIGASTAAAGAAIGLVALPIRNSAEKSWARDCAQ